MNAHLKIFSGLCLLIFVAACSGTPEIESKGIDDKMNSTQQGDLKIVARSKAPDVKEPAVKINNLMINISEIELEYAGTEGKAIPDYEFEREIEGDYTMILVSKGNPVEHELGSGKFPTGTLKEVEFDIEPAEDARGEMEGKSVYLSGTFRSRPFVWMSDDEYHLELITENFRPESISLAEDGNTIAILFDLGFLEERAADYFEGAVDTDEDNILEFVEDDLNDEEILKGFLGSVGIEKD